MSVSPYADVVLASGPVAYWRLEEASGNFFDTVGGRTVTVPSPAGLTYGVPSVLAEGSKGVAASGIPAPCTFPALVIGPTCSVEFWINTTNVTPGYYGMLTAAVNGFYHLPPRINLFNGADNLHVSPLPLGPCHVVASINTGAGTWYINGVPDGPIIGWLGDTFTCLLKAAANAGFNGLLDEVAIYPRALPAAEILAHYTARNATAQKRTTYAQRVILDGAVNYWRLGEASGTVARDEIGGAHGTISGGVTLNQPGLLADGDKAMRFDGVNGIVAVSAGSFLAPGTGPVTVECWVKTSVQQTFKRPCDFKNNGNSAIPGIGILTGGAGQIYLDVMYAGSGDSIGNVAPYADGAWHHVVGTVVRGAPDTGNCYFDGALLLARPLVSNGASLTSTTPGGIGAAAGGPFEPFAGLVDEVALYPYALTPAQILAHYQLGVGQFASMPQPTSAGLPLIDRPLLVGQAVLGASAGVDVAGCADLKIVVVGNGPVSAGMVTIEEAHDTTYAGTWAIRAGIPAQPGTTVLAARETAKAIRARVSTAIVGGSVSVYLVAR